MRDFLNEESGWEEAEQEMSLNHRYYVSIRKQYKLVKLNRCVKSGQKFLVEKKFYSENEESFKHKFFFHRLFELKRYRLNIIQEKFLC